MGLYYQVVMDKSKLEEANRLYNKITNLKSELIRISEFEVNSRVIITSQYDDSYFHIDEDMMKTYLPLIKKDMEKELKECERLFSEL